MDKSSVIDSLKASLQAQHSRAVAAAESAAEGATGDDTKAESKYDTRGLESSYLAAGQAGLADELARIIGVIDRFDFRDFSATDPIETGALVKVEFEGDENWYLIAPGGGGMTFDSSDGEPATVIGPETPLAMRLYDKKAGENLDDSPMKVVEVR